MTLPWNRPTVLAVGSVHLDVFGDFDGQDGIVDKRGQAYFAVGGTAFNIASYLGVGKQSVALLSVLTKGSVITRLLRWKLRASSVDTKYIFETIPEDKQSTSAFVAHRRISTAQSPPTRMLQSAVSSMPIEQLSFGAGTPERSRLDRALVRCPLVVVDANLNPDALATILSTAADRSIRVVAIATSDAKIDRIACASGAGGPRWLLVALRHRELDPVDGGRLMAIDDTSWTQAEIERLCTRLDADGVLLNRDPEDSLLLLRGSDQVVLRKIERPPDSKSDTGVGSALAAAVIAVSVRRQLINATGPIKMTASDQQAMQRCVGEYVRSALRTWGATPKSSLAFDDREARDSRTWATARFDDLRDFGLAAGARAVWGLVASHVGTLIVGLLIGTPIYLWFMHTIGH
jgi:hypothetical protein